MWEATTAGDIERDQESVEAPAVRETPSTAVPASVAAVQAANDPQLRRTRRRVPAIVWDDGGLKPFRVA